MALILPADMRSPFFRRNGWTRVRNVSGEVIPPHSVVLVTGAEISGGEIVLTVTMPNNGSSTAFYFDGYMVTYSASIYSSSTSEGLATKATEPCLVRYNSAATPTYGSVWGPKNGQFTLEQHYFGFAILGYNTASAENAVTVAQWVGINSVLGYTDGASTKGSGTVTVSVLAGAVNSDADTGMNITGVGNEFCDVDASKYVWVTPNGSNVYLTAAEF